MIEIELLTLLKDDADKTDMQTQLANVKDVVLANAAAREYARTHAPGYQRTLWEGGL